MRALFLAIAIGLLGWNDTSAQTWEDAPTSRHFKSVVKIMGNNGVSGSGTVVKKIAPSKDHEGFYLGLILTASHCVDNMSVLFEIEFYNGAKTAKNRPVKDLPISTDADNDLAVIRALIPNDVPITPLSSSAPKCGDNVVLSGYGAGDVRHWKAKFGGKKLYGGGYIILSWAIQGDSGGPVVYDGKVIGVICYGSGLRKFEGTSRMIVCPVYASNVSRIKEYIDEYKEKM